MFTILFCLTAAAAAAGVADAAAGNQVSLFEKGSDKLFTIWTQAFGGSPSNAPNEPRYYDSYDEYEPRSSSSGTSWIGLLWSFLTPMNCFIAVITWNLWKLKRASDAKVAMAEAKAKQADADAAAKVKQAEVIAASKVKQAEAKAMQAEAKVQEMDTSEQFECTTDDIMSGEVKELLAKKNANKGSQVFVAICGAEMKDKSICMRGVSHGSPCQYHHTVADKDAVPLLVTKQGRGIISNATSRATTRANSRAPSGTVTPRVEPTAKEIQRAKDAAHALYQNRPEAIAE